MNKTFFKHNLPVILFATAMIFSLTVGDITVAGKTFDTDNFVIFIALMIIVQSLLPLINDRNRVALFAIVGLLLLSVLIFILALTMTMIT